jgi:hypothetical protein
VCEFANPQKHRDDDDDDDVDNDSSNWGRDLHDGVELYKLHFVQSGRPCECRVMTYRWVAAEPILYRQCIRKKEFCSLELCQRHWSTPRRYRGLNSMV